MIRQIAQVRTTPEQVAQLLQSAEEPDATVHIVETHISWLFFTPSHVFKLKKPVRFEFLDYSTIAHRHWACGEEVRLNERLAPHVYEHILAITEKNDTELELNGDGPVLDWLVQMRRLPTENAVDLMLRENRLSAVQARRIAALLASFYKGVDRSSVGAEKCRAFLSNHIRANRASLLETLAPDAERLKRIHEAQLRYLNFNSEVFGSRVAGGHIVDGHGDLRPEHIYVDGEVLVIDCVEFSAEMRTVDVADELSFLTMECERLGDGSLGSTVMREYQNSSGDEPPKLLLDFYRSYRAAVRAKVISIRAKQQGQTCSAAADLESYLKLADDHASFLGAPVLIVISGLMGSGKSTLAGTLQRQMECDLLSTDRLRQEVFSPGDQAGFGEGHYTLQRRQQIYDEMLRRAQEALGNRRSAILDGTFFSHSIRDEARELARRHRAAFLLIHCVCPRATSLARIHRRTSSHSDSEARVEHYDLQSKNFQRFADIEKAITIDTTQPLREQLSIVLSAGPKIASA